MSSPSHRKPRDAFGKVCLLLWKNYLLQKRHYIQTALDIVLPILAFSLLVWLQSMANKYTYHPKPFPDEEIDSLQPLFGSGKNITRRLAFSPDATIFKDLVAKVSKGLNLEEAVGVADANQLESTIIDQGLIAGIEFHHSNTVNEIPRNLAYSLRFPAELRMAEYYLIDRNWQTNVLIPGGGYNERYSEQPSYRREGFLAIQNAIAKALITTKQPLKTVPEIRSKRFTNAAITYQGILTASVLISTMFVLGFSYPFMNTIRFLTIEKEKQLKEAMKIMGLSSWMHYVSWFIRSIAMLTIPVIAIIVLSKIRVGEIAILEHSNVACLLIVIVSYCLCLISLSFLISSFFTKSKLAMTASIFCWYITNAPGASTWATYDSTSGFLKILICLLPNSSITYGFLLIARFEELGQGLNFTTVFQTISVYDNLTVATIIGIFIIETVLFFLLALYVENVMPGAYGVAKPWYFPFTVHFWCGSNSNFGAHQSTAPPNANPLNFEQEPTNKPIGIEISQLTKKFTSDKAAVNQLSLNIYDNQITSLLGQNGAGKTTVISMLTGMMEPTAGTAFISGYDIRENMDAARNSMGFCPQHNILFDELTVREHILFYARLKGLTNAQAESDARKYIRLMDLIGKENAQSSTLSGGMKRKLSVVIALCGQSKVIFLDEPTAGMDPGARRTLWNILLAEKKDRTILLTTHFMDEADVLSDRIAIMVDGALRCTGSTFFLKKRFGTGYHLICAKRPRCDSRKVTTLLGKYIPNIQVESENETELCYLLPDERNDQFTAIFEELECNEKQLKLSGFGVDFTTLEEIFLKIGTSETFDRSKLTATTNNDQTNGTTRVTLTDDHRLVGRAQLLFNQLYGMLRKRFLCWFRALPSFCIYNCIVVFIMLVNVFNFDSLFSGSDNLPSLDMTLDKYKWPIVVQPEVGGSEFLEQFKKNVERSTAALEIVNDVGTALRERSVADRMKYSVQYLAAVSQESESIWAWYNGQAIHTASLALDLVHNALVRLHLGEDYSIHISNKPLAYQAKKDSDRPSVNMTDTLLFIIPIIMSVMYSFFVAFYIKEKVCNAKFLQFASGANVPVFWAASILWDVITICVTIAIIVGILAAGKNEQWKDPTVLGYLALILIMCSIAMIPLVCILSLIFTKPSLGTSAVSIFSFVILMMYLTDSTFHYLPTFLNKVFWAYPISTLYDSLPFISNPSDSTLSWSKGILKHLVSLLCIGIGAYIILVILEMGAIRWVKQMIFKSIKRTYPNVDMETIDNDVYAERERINKKSLSELKSETLVMQTVSKFYGKLCAVNKFSGAIKRAECFGLLGKNGAGKSSIFKMMTGETMITDGQIFTYGLDQKYQLSKIYEIVGYCPQFDALLPGMTCRETMTLFATLRGIPLKNVNGYVEDWSQRLGFIQHIDKKVAQLSGGNKRKLSSSLAFIGNVRVIFLDEPSAGMDPATKRNLWDVIIESRDNGKSIILTSHSIEECEALCTRITVLVNGQSMCLGSSQHLKNKFCKGFEMKIKVKQDMNPNIMNVGDVKNFIFNTFPGAIFREEYQGILTYSVPTDYIKWSSVFGIMEEAKKTLNIEDYSISQNSLEQVVLMFVKDQIIR